MGRILKLINPSKNSWSKILHRLNFTRLLFSCNKFLDAELTSDVKKNIEFYWKDKVNQHPVEKDAQKYYLLSMFPYPSGNLHMGHVRVYTISDALTRFFRMNGKKVIHPIGWDAFGLPAENAAVERNVHPFDWTMNNIETMKKQLKDFNICFDWDRELKTCDASYYKWTQYIFLLMFEHGLAYKKQALVNWDPVDQTVLADEQVDENGFSWRSGCKVEKRRLSQWFLRTSEFSKNLYDGLNDPSLIEWRDVTKIQQHWIGEPDGFIIHFDVFHKNEILSKALTVWTNTPELLYGAAFIGISPDNHFNASEYGGGSTIKDHCLDITVKHPFTGKLLPVFVSSNLNHSPATDSCLGIPVNENIQHLDFATKHNIDIIEIIDEASNCLRNSDEFSGMDRKTARKKIITKAENNGIKVYQASRKLRDWLISRQRYWGTPIPVINCPTCKAVPVPIKDLPVFLPKISDFTGKSCSLRNASDWMKVNCPKCGGPATRETDTMDTFVDSSWYFLRYLDVNNKLEPFNVDKINNSMPVDLYIGGKEHASLHLFYARFFCHFLHSIGMLKFREPFIQLLMQGMVLGKSYRVKGSGKYLTKEEVDFSDKVLVEKSSGSVVLEEWEKMSKSKYNGIDPQKVIEEHGIDTTRLFILGSVAPQSPRKWNDELFPGIKNFQWRVWLTVADFIEQKKLNDLHEKLSLEEIQNYEEKVHNARNYYTKKVTHNYIHTRQLSVVIAKLQGLIGELRRLPKPMVQSEVFESTLGVLLIMLAPMAPHFTSELWSAFCSAASGKDSTYDLTKPVLHQKWPEIPVDCPMEIVIKINGDEVDSIPIAKNDLEKLSAEKAIEAALNRPKVLDVLQGSKIKHAKYKAWDNHDSEINIVYKPPGKKAKKSKASNVA
ncbi:probable leucine--tRNA ligase, mitochondrial [Argiope bruennichi]|uniref:probable leucine--tRNA ligase, mitochondrial n=1 Tax=Argiope bruennichi TaxID=94029 RepID=UPI0024949540|nr:probable leucine--tRNA ligase, mitochondrial [Argiope bruennichi]